MTAPRPVSLQTARRLAVSAQALDSPLRPNDDDSILELIRRLGCVQLDPISVVARSHLLVLFARIGDFDPGAVDRLTYERKDLFEYWAHAASLVPTSDLRIHRLEMMRQRGQGGASPRNERYRRWVGDNANLRRHVLATLRREGPTRSRDIVDLSTRPWSSTGWSNERSVTRMLEHLWAQGHIVVAARQGGQRFWDLAIRHLPAPDLRARPSERSVTKKAAVRSLRALGIATPRHISDHFTRGRYPSLARVLAALIRNREIAPVTITDPALSDMPYLVHSADLGRLEAIEAGRFEGRTTLLSPFDNLISDRKRTQELFGFDYRIEIYVPAAKRRYGYYVMPLLAGDRLLGRIDARMSKKSGTLTVKAVHLEPGAPAGAQAEAEKACGDVARFLGATQTVPVVG